MKFMRFHPENLGCFRWRSQLDKENVKPLMAGLAPLCSYQYERQLWIQYFKKIKFFEKFCEKNKKFQKMNRF